MVLSIVYRELIYKFIKQFFERLYKKEFALGKEKTKQGTRVSQLTLNRQKSNNPTNK